MTPMRFLQLPVAALGLAVAAGAMGQVDARNVPLMPNGLPTDIDTLTRPSADSRPYAYQPPTVYGRPSGAPPYYERRYYGDRPVAPSPVPPDRSRDLTPLETRSLYGAPSQPRWDVPARPAQPARPLPKADSPKADSAKPAARPSPGANALPSDVTPD